MILEAVPEHAPAAIGTRDDAEQAARCCQRRPDGVQDLIIRIGRIFVKPKRSLVRDAGDTGLTAQPSVGGGPNTDDDAVIKLNSL